MIKWLIIFLILMTTIPLAQGQGFGHCDFGNYPFGNCEVTPPSGPGGDGSGGGGGFIPGFPSTFLNATNQTIQRYDVSVRVVKSIYSFNETVEAIITLENKGDIPDEDTVLIFWISNAINRKFGERREQILEIPPGKTVIKRSILLPESDLSGEWRFNVRYHTSIQSTIDVFDTFRVKEKLGLIDQIRNAQNGIAIIYILGAVLIVGVYAFKKRKYEEEKEDFKNE